MPYKKPDRQPLQMLLKAYDINDGPTLARVIGVKSATTGLAKLKDTRKLTVADLERINTHGHVPIEAIRAAIGAKV